MAKWVYMFTEGNATMRNLLGGKGANLAEMTSLGLPVPQGFTVTTEACTQYYEDGRKINDEIMAQIMEAIEKLGFSYPFSSLTVVQAQTGRADGALGSALVAVDADAKADELLAQMTRLCARQIFGVQVENDPWNAPWLSETLASCVELMAYRQREGDAAYEKRFYDEIEIATRLTRPHGVVIGASTELFGGDGEMTQVLRDAGAANLMGIEQAVGQETFIRALQTYIAENAGGIGSLEALESALERETGSDWSGYLADMLAS